MAFFKNKIFHVFSGLKNSLPGSKRPSGGEGLNAGDDIDKRLVYSFSRSKFPSFKQFKYLSMYLGPREKAVIRACQLVILFSLLFLGGRFYITHLQTVPETGGEYREGIVGAPKYINPLYASLNDVDSDLARLVFSSLFKRDKEGKIIGDLAESYTVSADGKNYSIKIRTDAKWNNGEKLTVDDIIFTFSAIQDKQFQSSLNPSFLGVSLEKIDDENIKFGLSEPYAGFLELLTFGILPQKIWEQIPPTSAHLAELNLKPVGSGPYKFKSLVKDKNGSIKAINLNLNENYYGEQPYIKDLSFSFFPSYEEMIAGLNNNQIDAINYLPSQYKENIVARDSYKYNRISLPQLTAVFFNPADNSILADKSLRKALALSMPKDQILSGVFEQDEYSPAFSPISPDSQFYSDKVARYDFNSAEAEKILTEAGWKAEVIDSAAIEKAQDDISSEEEKIQLKAESVLAAGEGRWLFNKDGKIFSIKLTTVNADENPKLAQAIADAWKNIGVKVSLELIPVEQIQNLIRTKKYNALLYAIALGSDPDPYPYWHSSQTDKGLNMANYSNKTVDALLEDARTALSGEVRVEKYRQFQEIITDEVPAIFLYFPLYNYVQGKKIKNFGTARIYSPSDRFSDICQWYIKTGRKIVW